MSENYMESSGIPVKELIKSAIEARKNHMHLIPVIWLARLYLPMIYGFIRDVTLKMLHLPQQSVQKEPHYSKQSAKGYKDSRRLPLWEVRQERN